MGPAVTKREILEMEQKALELQAEMELEESATADHILRSSDPYPEGDLKESRRVASLPDLSNFVEEPASALVRNSLFRTHYLNLVPRRVTIRAKTVRGQRERDPSFFF